MAVGPAGGAVVEVLDDNRLLAGVAARQEDDHLLRLQVRARGGSDALETLPGITATDGIKVSDMSRSTGVRGKQG